MTTTVDITLDPKDEGDEAVIRRKIERALRTLHQGKTAFSFKLLKRSIDARHGKVRLFLRYLVGEGISEERLADSVEKGETLNAQHSSLNTHHLTPITQHSPLNTIIVGTGPAAIFAALTLLKQGVKPVMAERGERTKKRKEDIAAISTKGTVDSDSNYCFGEGGAGTFSDGKLYTRSGKRGDKDAVLRELVAAGADERILTDSHPHIGTDRLPAVVTALIDKIIGAGGECRFNTRCKSLIIEGGRVRGIITEDTHTGRLDEIRGDAVLLATGHSASDIYYMLHKTAPAAIASKGFAVGVRVEHPRELIDSIQYHLPLNARRPPHNVSPPHLSPLGAAEYRLTSQAASKDGVVRGVYSFCMCPGGFVVPSATGPKEVVINGMSASGRNSQWSNSAIVMEVRAEDLTEYMIDSHILLPPAHPLLGLAWRTHLEHEAYLHGEGGRAPAQRLVDFLSRKDSTSLPRSSYTPGITSSRLDEWLPAPLTERLVAAFKAFDNKMHGFITEDAILIAGETRTSSPVRILRGDGMECPALPGLYAAGEGAGYAGGIVSSALDGVKAGEAIAERARVTS